MLASGGNWWLTNRLLRWPWWFSGDPTMTVWSKFWWPTMTLRLLMVVDGEAPTLTSQNTV